MPGRLTGGSSQAGGACRRPTGLAGEVFATFRERPANAKQAYVNAHRVFLDVPHQRDLAKVASHDREMLANAPQAR